LANNTGGQQLAERTVEAVENFLNNSVAKVAIILLVCNRYKGLNCEDFEAEQSEYNNALIDLVDGERLQHMPTKIFNGSLIDNIHPDPEIYRNRIKRAVFKCCGMLYNL